MTRGYRHYESSKPTCLVCASTSSQSYIVHSIERSTTTARVCVFHSESGCKTRHVILREHVPSRVYCVIRREIERAVWIEESYRMRLIFSLVHFGGLFILDSVLPFMHPLFLCTFSQNCAYSLYFFFYKNGSRVLTDESLQGL